MFPEQANITFVEKVNKRLIKVLFWERGGGHTLACGSGMCATAFVLHHNNLVHQNIKIKTERSQLKAFIDGEIVSLQGPAEIVYESSLQL
jgi:diaminopimelate epimerase